MNKILKWVFVALVVAGAIVSCFSDIAVVDIVALAVSFGSAGALCATTFNNSEKKDWKTYVSIILIAVGAFGLGFCGVTTEVISKVISAVAGLIAVILGIITAIKVDTSNKE